MRSRFTTAARLVTLLAVAAAAPHPATARPLILIRGMVSAGKTAPPTYAQCEAAYQAACYSPQDIRTAYGLTNLIKGGNDGTGQTIVLIEAYGSPTIAADLKQFDLAYNLPDPPFLEELAPLGTVPWKPKQYPDEPGWAGETTLDVEWSHAIAPGASIIVMTSPVDETEGVQGLPQFLQLEQYAVAHDLGQIISQSWSATENTLFASVAGPQGPQVVADYTAFYQTAVDDQVTVLASAGDDGSSNPTLSGSFYPFPTVGFPASSPLVTGVGGTDLHATATGAYENERVWNDQGCCAGAGGVSQLFKEPSYQSLALPASVGKTLAGYRGVPDISYNAAVGDEFILIYASYPGSGGAGWYGIGGTSEGSPQWAGIVADLNQYVGRPLGDLNPGLYAIGGLKAFGLIGRDITVGNNALTDVQGATAPGYSATTGWDLASGWGTPNLSALPTPSVLLTALTGAAAATK